MFIRFGVLLTVLGFGSAILHFTGVQFRLLMWAEGAQPFLGVGLGVVGVALLFVGFVRKSKAEQAALAVPQQQWAQQPYQAQQPGTPQQWTPQPGMPQPGMPGAPQGYGQPQQPAAPGVQWQQPPQGYGQPQQPWQQQQQQQPQRRH